MSSEIDSYVTELRWILEDRREHVELRGAVSGVMRPHGESTDQRSGSGRTPYAAAAD